MPIAVAVMNELGKMAAKTRIFDFIGIPRSSAAVGTNYGQCNINRLSHEMPHSSAVGSFTIFFLGHIKKYKLNHNDKKSWMLIND
jgi:hypothetical protein